MFRPHREHGPFLLQHKETLKQPSQAPDKSLHLSSHETVLVFLPFWNNLTPV